MYDSQILFVRDRTGRDDDLQLRKQLAPDFYLFGT